MIINPAILQLDIKIQDKFRELLANSPNGFPAITGVVLGDSDIDYNLQSINNAHIINAPFNVEKIKYPLIYSGSGKGLEGNITCFARIINDGDTNVSSTYNYPSDLTFIQGTTVPTLNNGFDWNLLNFGGNKQGYILFFQTLLLNYFDPNTNQIQRLNEPLDIEVTFNGSSAIPNNWEVTIDSGTTNVVDGLWSASVYNNSMLISKGITASSTFGLNTDGLIIVRGKLSNITKKVAFNI